MIRKIRSIIKLLFNLYNWSMAWFVKKDEKIWVFGAIRGQKYMDNAKYIFEYVHHETDIDAIWISKNQELVDELRIKGFNAYYEYTKEAKYFAKQAKVAVVTHRGLRHKADLPFQLFSKNTKVIQLWHGIPLKKIAFDDKIFSFKHDEDNFIYKIKSSIKNTLFPFLNYVHEPSLVLALSKETQTIFSQAFRIDKKNVQITGYPRSDMLLKKHSQKSTKNKKQVIYMPTFRGSIGSDFDLFLNYGFNIDKLDSFLEKKNMTLDIKLHSFNQPSPELIEKLEKSKNIFFLEYDAIYEIINNYSMLITDYSSIYFDYLLLDRPIIFAPFDKDTYLKEDREFYFDYDEITPGPKASNWEEVIELLEEYLNNKDLYKEERETLKNRFHTYQDTENSKRVYEAILNTIHE